MHTLCTLCSLQKTHWTVNNHGRWMLAQTPPSLPPPPLKIPRASTVCLVCLYEQWGQMLEWKYTHIFYWPQTNPSIKPFLPVLLLYHSPTFFAALKPLYLHGLQLLSVTIHIKRSICSSIITSSAGISQTLQQKITEAVGSVLFPDPCLPSFSLCSTGSASVTTLCLLFLPTLLPTRASYVTLGRFSRLF